RVGAVGRAGQQNRRVLRALRHENDNMQLHPVAHRDHRIAALVIEARRARLEMRRRLAGILRILRLLIVLGSGAGGQRCGNDKSKAHAAEEHGSNLVWLNWGKLLREKLIAAARGCAWKVEIEEAGYYRAGALSAGCTFRL